ncbi:MAG: Asp-tRNA(Asn)/Glu-tRNA(Gln) amidotransferase subunit GatC [Myxococcota bacterium]|jgi:aspartyl-tRNA(Asn)/glutamyl-tRNA(Gln) amidotransferase subunit C
MSHINRTQIDRVAELARLLLSDEEADRLASELDSFLGYVETLNELDTESIVPTSHPIPLLTPMRDDLPEPPIDPELAVHNAPETAAGAFVVPKVIDSESQ